MDVSPPVGNSARQYAGRQRRVSRIARKRNGGGGTIVGTAGRPTYQAKNRHQAHAYDRDDRRILYESLPPLTAEG
jgi:hypothetical protein